MKGGVENDGEYTCGEDNSKGMNKIARNKKGENNGAPK
jgi:hypothetical protein